MVALGVDSAGVKQVLGVWHGASENSTVVKALLEDLVERGLDAKRSIVVVIDGAKALRKAVRALFGERALVQRCRIHKRRNCSSISLERSNARRPGGCKLPGPKAIRVKRRPSYAKS